MRLRLLPFLALPVAACDKEDTAETFGPLTGTLAIDGGESVQVNAGAIFGYEQGGKALLYFASNPAATCDDVTSFLDTGSRFDPSNLFSAGHCNVFAVVQDFSGAEVSYASDPLKVTWALNCVIGEGSFLWEERGDDDGYYWSGRYWQGSPSQWSITLSGGGGDDLDADIEMNDYDGDFIYEFTDAGATGLVSGSVRATWCSDLSETAFF